MKHRWACLVIAAACLCGAARPLAAADEDAEQPEAALRGRPLKEIVLEANAVQIVLNDEHRQGVDWEAIVSDYHTLQLRREDNPGWADKKYRVSVGTVSNDDYAVLLDALDTVGRMTQDAQPSVRVRADVGETMTMVLPNKSGDVRVHVLLANSSSRGPQLHIEPLIGAVLHDSGSPMAATLKAQTNVDLKEDMTVVIGGITSEQEITKTHKFPLLGNLPLVGLVFRSQGRLMQKIETVIFLTPRLNAVQGTEQRAS